MNLWMFSCWIFLQFKTNNCLFSGLTLALTIVWWQLAYSRSHCYFTTCWTASSFFFMILQWGIRPCYPNSSNNKKLHDSSCRLLENTRMKIPASISLHAASRQVFWSWCCLQTMHACHLVPRHMNKLLYHRSATQRSTYSAGMELVKGMGPISSYSSTNDSCYVIFRFDAKAYYFQYFANVACRTNYQTRMTHMKFIDSIQQQPKQGL